MGQRDVLVPVDDSEASEVVLNWVVDNIVKEGDEVHLLHVIPVPMPDVVAGGFGGMEYSVITVDPDPKEDLKHIADAKDMMRRRFTTLLASKGIPYQVEIVHFLTDTQSVGEAICSRAEGLHAFAIAMAKHNRGKIASFFLGSTTRYVSEHAPCPLIVVDNQH
jgi:nucleotide-binding universal stress UspA family protein